MNFMDLVERLDDILYDEVLSKFDDQHIEKWLIAFGAGLLDEKKQLRGWQEELLHKWGLSLGERLRGMAVDRGIGSHPPALPRKDRKSLRQLQRMDPFEFEKWTGRYLLAQGYRDVVVTQGTADFGVDVYMRCPNGAPAVAQCKRYKAGHLVGRPIVQQTYGVMHLLKAKYCYVITTSGFSEPALELQRDHRHIVLINGKMLCATG